MPRPLDYQRQLRVWLPEFSTTPEDGKEQPCNLCVYLNVPDSFCFHYRHLPSVSEESPSSIHSSCSFHTAYCSLASRSESPVETSTSSSKLTNSRSSSLPSRTSSAFITRSVADCNADTPLTSPAHSIRTKQSSGSIEQARSLRRTITPRTRSLRIIRKEQEWQSMKGWQALKTKTSEDALRKEYERQTKVYLECSTGGLCSVDEEECLLVVPPLFSTTNHPSSPLNGSNRDKRSVAYYRGSDDAPVSRTFDARDKGRSIHYTASRERRDYLLEMFGLLEGQS